MALSLTAQDLADLTPRRVLLFSPHEPTDLQIVGLLCEDSEVFYGGAAGGGKSDWLLMGALQYVDIPGYSALLLRRTHPQLMAPGGLIPRSQEWLAGTPAKWSEQNKRWTFPSGAILQFGSMQYERDKHDYQSSEFQFVGFDELTHFLESQYRYLFSRLRRLTGSRVPLRMRSASNPGGTGHEWVKRRMIDERHEAGRIFIPAKLADNPYLDQDEYVKSLAELDPITRAQLLSGDWSARQAGGIFRREWFGDPVDAPPSSVRDRRRYWDLAATAPKPGTDPDWTVGALLSVTKDKTYYVEDVQRFRGTPQVVEARLKQTAAMDGRGVKVDIEEEPGSSGKIASANYVKALAGYTVRPDRVTGSKLERARPFSSQCEAGNVKLVRGPWLSAFFDELEAFPASSHDDQVDACSGAFGKLTKGWGWDALYPEAEHVAA